MGEVTANVENTVRGWISSGEYGPGSRLPSERQMASTLGAGRTTIRLVLAKLAAEGLIRSEHGRGYFVCEPSR
ncbi:winged helix-turn-helix domain-containing protein [Actinoplanes sp. NPDC024001]|uniref:winged helix-turn-helix domain-containing protein n=1 Tax=Actinoplanes sp. NPDC024001 TaxID=3154598 RepID=UPI003405A4A2